MKEKVKTNPQLDESLKDFKTRQLALQASQMMGQQMDQEAMAQVQSLYGILSRDPLAAEYLQCEMRFSLMINDVYQILAEVIDLGLKGMGGDGANGR